MSASSPLSALQTQFARPRSIARFNTALSVWSQQDPALAGITSHDRLVDVLRGNDYPRHDVVLHSLLCRAAVQDDDGHLAAELVVNAMIPAVPGVVGCVIRATRAATFTSGARRGVTGSGVSASESNRDIQAGVIGHLWEMVCCYPLRRRNHVAANLTRETQRAALRSFGVDLGQTAAEVVSMDNEAFPGQVSDQPAELDASEELLELLSWAVEQQRLDEEATAILTARYFGDQIGRDGVATDRQVGVLLGLSQPTITRHRQRAVEQLASAALDFPGVGRAWAS
ncbi:hypothetical protein SAMN05421504_112204 [Amycolatopsis xylanica]|uniref:Uncharacterized protein n=1 Tax=Amycolatopsis xylanica TaxID=589385 RepID=A0A1H3S3L3_9PSEU|nr:hypothetical protein [Amycolatopsis xylanica]SDZ32522.1 hypothetical protein SAMN05421504_112204 [Amycolatopsis xylanica]